MKCRPNCPSHLHQSERRINYTVFFSQVLFFHSLSFIPLLPLQGLFIRLYQTNSFTNCLSGFHRKVSQSRRVTAVTCAHVWLSHAHTRKTDSSYKPPVDGSAKPENVSVELGDILLFVQVAEAMTDEFHTMLHLRLFHLPGEKNARANPLLFTIHALIIMSSQLKHCLQKEYPCSSNDECILFLLVCFGQQASQIAYEK